MEKFEFLRPEERKSDAIGDKPKPKAKSVFDGCYNFEGVEELPTFDMTAEYEKDKPAFSYKGVPLYFFGSVSAVTGQSGHGKSSLMAIIIAAALGKDCCGAFRWCAEEKPRILLVDTEQKENFIKSFVRKVFTIMGSDIVNRDDFKILPLLRTLSAEERRLQTMLFCKNYRPNVIIIDGMLDMVVNMNSIPEVTRVVREFMLLADELNAMLLGIVHQNPGRDDKMAGHLGSWMERKSTDVINVRKIKEGVNVYFEVSQQKARGQDAEDFIYTYAIKTEGEQAIPMICDINEFSPIATNPKDDTIKIFEGREAQRFTKQHLVSIAHTSLHTKTKADARRRVEEAIKYGYIKRYAVRTGGGDVYGIEGGDNSYARAQEVQPAELPITPTDDLPY